MTGSVANPLDAFHEQATDQGFNPTYSDGTWDRTSSEQADAAKSRSARCFARCSDLSLIQSLSRCRIIHCA